MKKNSYFFTLCILSAFFTSCKTSQITQTDTSSTHQSTTTSNVNTINNAAAEEAIEFSGAVIKPKR